MESWLIYQKHTKLIQFADFCSNFAFRTFLVFHKNLPLLCFPQGGGGQAHTQPAAAAQRTVSG